MKKVAIKERKNTTGQSGIKLATNDSNGETETFGNYADEKMVQDRDAGSKEMPNIPVIIVHEQPDAPQDTGEDGYLPVRDEWLDISNRIDNHPSAEQAAYNLASKMAYLIRGRQNDESCKTSVAACDAYTSMWPQIDGLCDLFFVKCLIDVVGMICRSYTEKDIFKYAQDLCDNVSDFCTQNREATIAFCWDYLYHRYGEITMNPQPPKTGFNRYIESLI
uniref:Uncharacterized protein n=1 Tax=Setaria digitata TaxID=48799 RepID=A0A915PW40_9BILA